jgi:hypothetical protein
MTKFVKKRKTVPENDGVTEEVSLSLQSSAVQAAYVNKLWPSVYKAISEVEIDEFRLPGDTLQLFLISEIDNNLLLESTFIDARSVEVPRDLEHLKEFITKGI